MSAIFSPQVTLGGNVFPNAAIFKSLNVRANGGTTLNNLFLSDPDTGEPAGYLHFFTLSPGDITLTGMDPSFLEFGGADSFGDLKYTKLIFVKNHGPGNVIITQLDPLSEPTHQFNGLGAPSITLAPSTIGANILVIYGTHTRQWEPGP